MTHIVCGQGAPATGATPSSAEESGAGVLQEVVVTAEKRSENLQKTPAAITAVSGTELQSLRIVTQRDLEVLAPSANFSQEGQNTIAYIRGVGTANDFPNSDPSVVTQVNQGYTPRPATGATLFDIDRVEILPGPQGTLYGRNAIGGVTNMTTRRPGATFGGEALFEVGNYAMTHEFAAADLPVSNELQFRIAANHEQNNGYLSNGFDDEDATAGRLTGLYKSDFGLSVFGTYTYYHDTGTGNASVQYPYVNASNPWQFPNTTAERGAYNQREFHHVVLNFDYAFADGITLTYIPTWFRMNNNQMEAQNGNSLPTSNDLLRLEPLSQYTNELRLAGDTGSLHWVGGLYQYWSDTHSQYLVITPGFVSIPPFDTVAIDSYNRENSYAAFTQVTDSLTDTLRVTGGLRYSSDQKSAHGFTAVTLFPPITPVEVPLPPAPYTFDRTWHNVDWKIGAEWDVAPRSMLYANVSSGYLEGGYSLVPSTPTFNNSYSPEKLIAFTLGIKNRFLDNRLEVNDEFFYYDYKDYQVSFYNVDIGTSVNYNEKRAEIYGNDLGIKFLLTRNDQIDLSVGLLSAYARDFKVPTGVPNTPLLDFDGYRLPDSPTATVTGGYQHVWTLNDGSSLTGRVQSHYDSGEWEIFSHPLNAYQPSTTKTDVTLSYEFAGGHWTVGLWAKNLENSARFVGPGTTTVPGINTVYIEAPRTYGARFALRFY